MASTAAAVPGLSLAASAAFNWNWAIKYRSSLVLATFCAAATFWAIVGASFLSTASWSSIIAFIAPGEGLMFAAFAGALAFGCALEGAGGVPPYWANAAPDVPAMTSASAVVVSFIIRVSCCGVRGE